MFHDDARQNAPFIPQHIQNLLGHILGAFFGFGLNGCLNRSKRDKILRLNNC